MNDNLKILTEADLEREAEESATEWAANWAKDWGRVLPKFAKKIGRPESEALTIIANLAIYAYHSAAREQLIRDDARGARNARQVEEVRSVNEVCRQANSKLIWAVEQLEPVLKRLARPWYLRLFA